MIVHELNMLVDDVWIFRLNQPWSLLLIVNDPRFEQELRWFEIGVTILKMKEWMHTIGAKMTSSYARRPYFTGFFRGLLTKKSYAFKPTSL